MTPADRALPAPLAAHLSAVGSVTWSELPALEVGTRTARSLVRAGVLQRAARGVYVDGERLRTATPRERHLLMACAVSRVWPPGAAVSHGSAAVLWDLPVLAVPDRVLGSRASGQRRASTSATLLQAYPGMVPRTVCGVEVVPAAHAVLGVLDRDGLESGLVVLDGALRAGCVTVEEMDTLLGRCRSHQVHRVGRLALELADARGESPGETRTRLLLHRLGVRVRSQVEIVGPTGEWIGRADFVVEGERVIVEFDGMVKYTDHRREVVADKRRDLAMQRAGYEVLRLVWQDLSHPEQVRQMVAEAVRRARGHRPR